MFKGKYICILPSMILIGFFIFFTATEVMSENAIILTTHAVITPDGTKFIVDVEQGKRCGEPKECIRPGDKSSECRIISLSQLLYTQKNSDSPVVPVKDVLIPGSDCSAVIIQDESKDSTYYCVGKRCYY
jgi:hypothetical protein